MSKFIPTTKRNGACEICGDTSGKCRRLADADIHLCMTFGDARKGEVQNGYKCLKPDKGKGWATFKLDNSQEWSEEQRREWQAKAQARRQQQQAAVEARKKRSIAEEERDHLYRQLLSELELHPDDRADLRRRGYSDFEIDRVGYKSVSNYQPLQHRYPELLPGIASGGQRLINLGMGYLCPIRNQSGLIVSCQLRLRVIPTGQKNRYRWFSQEEKGHVPHFFPKDGNPEGELPLAICRPQDKSQFVALAEGTGAKPNFVALRWNAFTIGAAGGQWASSPATLKDAIEAGIAESGDRCIRLYPDGGDIQNRHVAPRWENLINLLQEWGYPVLVGWWNQRSKDDPDIDELSPEQFAQIRYLEPKDFLAILAEQFPKKGFGSDSTPQKQAKKDDRAWELWRLARTFTPTHTTNQQYFDALVPEPGTLMGVKSGLGTGKTEWIKRVVEQLQGEGWIALGYRNSLLIQSATRWGFYHLHKDDAQNLLADPYLKVALCVDSLIHFEPHYFNNKNVILDEACSVIPHLLFARTAVGKQRRECKAKFAEALRRAKRIFVLDGLLSDKDIAYLKRLIGDPRKVVKIKNEYQGNGKNIFMLRGSITEEKVKLNDRSPLVQLIKTSQCCAIATDSQIEAEALDNILTQQGKQVARLDSKTSSETWVSALLNDTTNWFAQNRPDVFIFTPSAESGVDIPIANYFKQFFCLFFGAVLTNAQQQMLGRIRDTNCPTFVYCRTAGIPGDKISRAALPEDLMRVVTDFVMADGWATLSDIPQEQAVRELFKQVTALSQNEHFHHECQLLALQNHEERNLRECLIEALVEAGHKLQEVVLERSNIDDLTTAKEEVKDCNAQDIFKAETITIEEANNIDSKTGLDWETRCKIQKAKLIDRLPGIDQSEQWSDQFIRRVLYDDRDLMSQCELFWLLHHPNAAKQLQQSRWFGLLRAGQVDLAHHRSRYLKIKAMREIGLEKFLEPGFTWHKDSPEAQHLYKICKASHRRQAELGLSVGKLEPVDYVGRILKKLGVSTTGDWITTEKERIRVYRVDMEALRDADKLVIMQALDSRYRSFLEGTNEAIDWESLFVGRETLTTSVQQALEPDHLPTHFYKNQESGDQFLAMQNIVSASSNSDKISSPVIQPEASEGVAEAVQSIEQCLSFQHFAEVGQRLLRGKPEQFIHQLFQLLMPETLQRVLGWSRQMTHSV
ncbi:MAG: plasmid replication protein, CyRepA1 family [Leptolyngbyaceae cyanobacterium bins.59]|nr:plasmid replication protein, CyRepA1 family [Leptolyngbyaceae cyanobacterium bins.59]